MSVVPFPRPFGPAATAEYLTRLTIMVMVEAALEQTGRRNVEVTISPRCACGCNRFGVRLRSSSGVVQYPVNGLALQRAAVEIDEIVKALPGARDVN